MIFEDAKPIKDERTKVFSHVIFKKPVAVIIQTPGYRICGDVHVRPDDRLRDELNKTETFLAVTDATIYDDENQIVSRSKFIAVNCSHIIWLAPRSDLIPSQDEK